MEAQRKGKSKKTIKKIIKAKISDWAKSIDDDEIKQIVSKKSIVTGGSIASMLLGEKVKDFDIYFRDKESALKVAQYYVNKFNEANKGKKTKISTDATAFVMDCDNEEQVKKCRKTYTDRAGHMKNLQEGRIKIVVPSDGVSEDSSQEGITEQPFEDVYEVLEETDETSPEEVEEEGNPQKERYKPLFLSSNAITLSNKVQIVVRFYGNPDEIHENYDFAHCTNYYDAQKDQVTLRPKAMESLLSRELVYQGSKYPLCSVIRTRKFVKRGWHINAGQYLKMLFQASQLDLNDIDTLEDQLVGVDSAYFMQIIDALRKKKESDPNFEVNETYLGSLIDRIF